MATLDVKATITGPDEIKIPLVRADLHNTQNIFRLFFEVFLALVSGLLGNAAQQESLSGIHWFSIVIFGVSALAFLGLTIYYGLSKQGLLTCYPF